MTTNSNPDGRPTPPAPALPGLLSDVQFYIKHLSGRERTPWEGGVLSLLSQVEIALRSSAAPPRAQTPELTCWWCKVTNTGPMVINDERTIAMCPLCVEKVSKFFFGPSPAVPPADPPHLQLHRCKICGTRWLLWPEAIHGGGWNLLDKYSKPGACCDNVAMGEQIEHLRDFDLAARPSSPDQEPRP